MRQNSKCWSRGRRLRPENARFRALQVAGLEITLIPMLTPCRNNGCPRFPSGAGSEFVVSN